MPDERGALLALPMSALDEESSSNEVHIHVRASTPLRPTRGQIVNGVVIN
jgi:hypothetical protein